MGYADSELAKFAVNARGAPQGVGAAHLADELDGAAVDGLSSATPWATFPAPEKSESRSMPTDDGAGLNQAEPRFPMDPSSG